MPPTSLNPTAAFIIIGNEILSGRTQDKNLNYIALGLNEAGVRFRECRVIPDIEETIIATVNELRKQFTYVFTSGGIGPTHDDITSLAVANAFSLPLIEHPEARRRLEQHYAARNMELNEARLKMAYVPEGATLIDNPVSAAPGFRIENVYVLAGVPSIMQAMFDSIKAELKGGKKMLSREVKAYIAEGTIAKDLSDLQSRFPDIEIGSYPFILGTRLGTSLVLRGVEETLLDNAEEQLKEVISLLNGKFCQ